MVRTTALVSSRSHAGFVTDRSIAPVLVISAAWHIDGASGSPSRVCRGTEVGMKRREFVEKVSMGSAALITGGALGASGKAPAKAAPKRQAHDHSPVNGDKALAVVAF